MKLSPVENAPELVFESDSGHLFLINDSNKCQEQHLGLFDIEESILRAWVSHLVSMVDFRKEKPNMSFCFLPAPDKQSVYWGDVSEKSDCRNILKLFERISSGIYLDPLPILQTMVSDGVDVYPKVDTHWNSVGAMAVLNELLARWRLNVSPEVFKDCFVDTETFGDLGNKLTPKRSGKNVILKPALWRKNLLYDNGVPDNGRIRVFSNPDAPVSKRLCFVGDSFSYRFVELASLVFKSVFHFHGSFLDRGYFRVVQPDFFVFEQTERFFVRPPRFNVDNLFDRLVEEKIEAKIDVPSIVNNFHFFEHSNLLDINQMLVVAMSEEALIRNGVINSTCVPDVSALVRVVKSRV